MPKPRADVLAVIKAHPEGITSAAITAKLGLHSGIMGGADSAVKSAVNFLRIDGLVRSKKEPRGHRFRSFHFAVEQIKEDTNARSST